MSILYLLIVYEKDTEIARTFGHKTSILKTVNTIMKDNNKDITFQIKLAQQ